MNFIFASGILRRLNFSLSVTKCRIKSMFWVFRRCKSSSSTTQFPIDNITNLKKDIILYSYEKHKLFKYLTVFGIGQLGVWIFYAGFLFVNLRDVSKSGNKTDVLSNSTLWRRINLGDITYRIISTALCIGVGSLTAIICCALPSRIVRELTLCKGGKTASVVTYGIFGKPVHHKFPLQNLSCHISREEAKSYIAVKIKPKWFYFLVDSRGIFLQPKLFDYTVGTKNFKAY